MDNMLIGFFMATLCWLVSCIVGTLLVNAFIPVNGIPLTTFEELIFVAIGWIVFNHNSKDKDYQTSFNIWMTILYIPTLLSVL